MIKKLKLILCFTLLLNIAILSGCSSPKAESSSVENNSIQSSDLMGYWVNKDGYDATPKKIVDTVFEFIEGDKLVVYSYFDGGKNIYNYEVKKSTDKTITILFDDEVKKDTEMKFVDKDTIEFKAASNDDIITLIRIAEKEALEYIDTIEKYAEY